MPTAAPTTTSELQCTPVWTREYATVAASGATASAVRGLSSATAVAKAAAAALCPDGNDDEVGALISLRGNGSSSAAGLRRATSDLSTTLTTKLAPPTDTMPRNAALRVAPGRTASAVATPVHSRL